MIWVIDFPSWQAYPVYGVAQMCLAFKSGSHVYCHGAAMAPLCKLAKGGAVRVNDIYPSELV